MHSSGCTFLYYSLCDFALSYIYRQACIEATNEGQIHDPPALNLKRPRTAQITGHLEGQPHGGGGRSNGRGGKHCQCCSICREEGHQHMDCPFLRA